MHFLERWLSTPYSLSLLRIVGHLGIALTALLMPALGENRLIVAGLLAFVIAPAVLFLTLRFNSERSAWVDPLMDLFTVLGIVAFMPEFWHLALLVGVVISQAPVMALAKRSYWRFASCMAILLLGMSAIAWVQNVENWQLSILVLVAVYPSVLLFAYSQSLRSRKIQQKAEAFSALQLLSSGVVHDFNNILTAISGYAKFSKTSGLEPLATERALEKIIESAEQAKLLTEQLMSFSGDNKRAFVTVDVSQEVISIAEMLATTLRVDIKIIIEPSDQSVIVKGDPVKLHQVLLNLMMNAVEASNAYGVVRVKVSQINSSVQIEVADDGEGISNTIKKTMFQPFFTTKRTGHGLGLAVVKSFVDEHHGTIDVVSNVGMGTRFVVRLPGLESEASGAKKLITKATDQQASDHKVRHEKNLILIADDESPIRMILRQVLEMQGFEVLEAEDGNRFGELFKQHQAKICLVVLDVKMPGRSGWQCLDQARGFVPGLPALIVSGYDPEGPTIQCPDYALKFLAKPFGIAEVRQAVVDLLEPDDKRAA
ncbi:MAG: signal transduction histidine kinase/ActR/RegA family two-component response regulator [Sulfitobacter sp.]